MGEGSGKVIFNMETDQGMAQRGINFAVVDHDFIDALEIKIVTDAISAGYAIGHSYRSRCQ